MVSIKSIELRQLHRHTLPGNPGAEHIGIENITIAAEQSEIERLISPHRELPSRSHLFFSGEGKKEE